MTENTVLVAEFNAEHYDPRAGSNSARLLTVTTTETGEFRVFIEAPSPVSASLPFVVLSEDVISAAMYTDIVLPAIKQIKGLVVRKGSL